MQTGEFLNVGVILFCRTQRYLGLRLVYDPVRLAAFVAPLSGAAVEEQLRIMDAIGEGRWP